MNENLIGFKDRRGQTSTFSYDSNNRLIGESYQDESAVTRSYDANDRLAAVGDTSAGSFGLGNMQITSMEVQPRQQGSDRPIHHSRHQYVS